MWLVTGHYGSGKTEFSVNYALRLAAMGLPTALIDIDIVNPYFRSREKREQLEREGIQVAASAVPDGIDLPALSPRIYGLLQDSAREIVFDVGGDDDGARILGRFSRELDSRRTRTLFVLNARRPRTATAERALECLRRIERGAGRRVDGIVSNTHLCQLTSEEDLRYGDALAGELSRLTGIPVLFRMVTDRLAGWGGASAGGEELVICRYMKKPWE